LSTVVISRFHRLGLVFLCDADHRLGFRRSHHGPVRIDLDFDLMTVDGKVFRARELLGRPTVLVLLRYLG
jgi:hypothetical protein